MARDSITGLLLTLRAIRLVSTDSLCALLQEPISFLRTQTLQAKHESCSANSRETLGKPNERIDHIPRDQPSFH